MCAHRNQEHECLIENHERNQNMKAIKELLPLLAYPVIFFVISMFPLINRIYSAISSNASFELVLAHSITEPLYGFCSSWTLIIHILIMRQLKKKKLVQFLHPIFTNVTDNHGTNIYTTDTEGTTNTRSKYSIPAESDIDNE